MVVPIGNIANKFFFPSTFSSFTISNSQASSLPTLSSSIHMGMDISKEQVPTNDIEIRGRTPTSAINLSRESLIVSSSWATSYYDRMDNRRDYDSVLRDKSSELSYETEQKKAFHFSKVFETTGNIRPQDEYNKASHHNPECVLNKNQINQFPCVKAPQDDNNDVINIQLLYDPNSPTELDLWSGNFHPISLYGSIKQIVSDYKSIKDSLNFMARYIKNKKVNASKTNDLSDFDSIEDSI